MTGADGRQYSGAVPPDRLHPGVLARMRANATRLLAPPLAEVMTKTRQPLLQAIVDLETPAMIVGRVALVGDAAFVARPHVGMGTTKAAGDARALADHLARHATISMPHWRLTEPSGWPMVSVSSAAADISEPICRHKSLPRRSSGKRNISANQRGW